MRNAQRRLFTRSAGDAPLVGPVPARQIGATVRPFAFDTSSSSDTWPAPASPARQTTPSTGTVPATGTSTASGTSTGATTGWAASVTTGRPRRWDRRAGLARAAGRPFDAVDTTGSVTAIGRPGVRAVGAATTTAGSRTEAVGGTAARSRQGSSSHPTRTVDRWIEPAAAPATPTRQPVGAPLPQAYRSLAAALGNHRPVRVVHGAGAREALRRAGVPAATVGDAILLDRPPSTAPVMRERIAHELVHTAAGGTTPRLFGDPVHDGEERAARRVGHLARQLAPVALDGAAGRPRRPRHVPPHRARRARWVPTTWR